MNRIKVTFHKESYSHELLYLVEMTVDGGTKRQAGTSNYLRAVITKQFKPHPVPTIPWIDLLRNKDKVFEHEFL